MTVLDGNQHDNWQVGPPGSAALLREVVESVTYKPGWTIVVDTMERPYEHLAGGAGLTLRVTFMHSNSLDPEGGLAGLDHYFAVPPAAYSREMWQRWVLDCLIQIETHECMEFCKFDGVAPYFPTHGTANGWNPYMVERDLLRRNWPTDRPPWVERLIGST